MARERSPRLRLVSLALGSLAAACGPAPTPPATSSQRPAALVAAPPPTASTPRPPTVCPGALTETAPDRGWFALGASAPPSSATPAPSAGVVSPSAGAGATPSAVYDAEGRLVVAWAAAPGVRLRRLEGGRFQDLPPISAQNVGGFGMVTLTRDSAGRALVSFFEDTRVRVHRIEGNTVVDLSPKSPPPARSFTLPGPPRIITCPAVVQPVAPSQFAVDGEGRPMVAWAEAGIGSMRAVVHRWTGAAWVTSSFPGIGPVDDCAPHTKSVTLASDPKGNPYITFRKDRAISVMTLSGSAFTTESTLVPEHDAIYMSDPWLAFGPKNVRWKAWNEQISRDGASRYRVHVWRSDEKGSRVAKQPADRPLFGQILAFAGGARPRIAVLDTSGTRSELRVVAWENDEPVELTGGPGAADFPPARTHGSPAVALPEGSTPTAVVYRGGNEIAARIWSAGAYHAPGGAAEPTVGLGRGVAEGVPPAIAMRGGRVAVAWLVDGAKRTIEVRRWTGCAWETAPELPLEPGRPGSGLHPALTIDAEGRVVLVFSTSAAGSMVVARWAGRSWELLHQPRNGAAPGGPNAGQALAFGVEMDGSGAPVVAWADRANGKLGLARYLGQGQDFRLISSEPAPLYITPTMTTDGAGRPVVGMLDWKDRSAFVGYTRRLEGDRFVDVPPWTSPPTSNSGFPPDRFDLAAGPSGEIALAFRWSQTDAPYVALWNGSSWNTIAAPGMGGSGDAPGPGGSPAITFDEAGGLRLAYADRASGEVLVKRFVGGAWSPNEPGASAADSVSRSEGASVDPAIAASGGTVCVAWSEREGGEGRVLLRCRR
ncbi:hypothetical protein [Polyangium sp. 6x1]|uniref:hypothetical protein n=1 Tax=Polyangium sp. 6x1 TaxID=3042689 RepID=UPI0024824E84|nr:hypothetical protein [Polyangium sp. 6x1]MDI1447542.1 hypothetical protein [Polyangium sp. 6x1]